MLYLARPLAGIAATNFANTAKWPWAGGAKANRGRAGDEANVAGLVVKRTWPDWW